MLLACYSMIYIHGRKFLPRVSVCVCVYLWESEWARNHKFGLLEIVATVILQLVCVTGISSCRFLMPLPASRQEHRQRSLIEKIFIFVALFFALFLSIMSDAGTSDASSVWLNIWCFQERLLQGGEVDRYNIFPSCPSILVFLISRYANEEDDAWLHLSLLSPHTSIEGKKINLYSYALFSALSSHPRNFGSTGIKFQKITIE